mmetsp:Transcript_9203/g.30436  ORF Transcript_9203/g.30436 Transcript_9203/m.30436 type:complete len:203 (-) Transcript_9203:18-626(-)
MRRRHCAVPRHRLRQPLGGEARPPRGQGRERTYEDVQHPPLGLLRAAAQRRRWRRPPHLLRKLQQGVLQRLPQELAAGQARPPPAHGALARRPAGTRRPDAVPRPQGLRRLCAQEHLHGRRLLGHRRRAQLLLLPELLAARRADRRLQPHHVPAVRAALLLHLRTSLGQPPLPLPRRGGQRLQAAGAPVPTLLGETGPTKGF